MCAGASVDLYWLPLGAGGHSVRLNGRVYELLAAGFARRPPCDLYHSALVVRVPEGRVVVGQAPVPDRNGSRRGVVAEGPVGSRRAARWRLFRYEVRCWPGGSIPDIDEAVDSPLRLSTDPLVARRLLHLVSRVPTLTWGRDESGSGGDVELELDHGLASRPQRDRDRPRSSAERRPRARLACGSRRGESRAARGSVETTRANRGFRGWAPSLSSPWSGRQRRLEASMERQKRVLIAGGGVAALEAALALRRIAEERVHVELLAPEPRFTYRPLSVAAPFEQGEIMELELEEVARELGMELTRAGFVGVDAWRHIAHTSKNTEREYDLLLIACGALPLPAIPGALTFRGPADVELMRGLLRDLAGGTVESVAFVIPWGAVYSLPAYELALLTRAHLDRTAARGVEIVLVTPEAEPLQVFGPTASEAIRGLFAERGIVLRTGAFPREVVDDELLLAPEGSVAADRIVALPRLVGAPIDGIPQTVDGFVPVDAHCRVHGVADVYAAGDITSFTVKHGGIATQQADAAAEAIAAAAGADLEPSRFRPVLRGMLLTGSRPRYLRRELGAARETEPVASLEPLWWPPAKIVGRRLAPFLAAKAGAETPATPVDLPGSVEIEHALEPEAMAGLDATRLLLSLAGDDEPHIAEVMARTPLVAPEDTLGEAAEKLLRDNARAVVVVEFGRGVGILTQADLLRASAARAHPAEARVRQWMTAEPVTVPPDASVSAARTLMEQYGVHQLPVVEGETVLGLVDREQVDRVLVPSPGLGF